MAAKRSVEREHTSNCGQAMTLLQPIPLSPQMELAMRASASWFTAAQKLLSDVRGELGELAMAPLSAKADGRGAGHPRSATRRGGTDEPSCKDEPLANDAEPVLDGELQFDAEAGGEGFADASTEEAAGKSAVGSSLDAYLRQLRRVTAPSLEEEQELVRAAQAGYPDAVNRLVSRSLRIVPPIARAFVGRGLPLEDLIEEGNLGLYRAVPRFDLALGHRFATYARWWVKHEIRTAVLNQGRLIRLPVHVYRALSRVRRQLESVGKEMPYATRARDEGQDLGGEGSEATRLTLLEAQALLRLTELPLSLDMPFEGDAETPLVDTVAGEVDESPEARIQQEQRARLLTAAIERLSFNEREVVMRRYGFATGEPETLEAIGKSLKLTAERVRQIQKQALLTIQQDFAERGLSLDELL